MRTFLVNFESLDGLSLDGALFMPQARTRRVVLHVHGYMGSFYQPGFVNTMARALAREGWAMLSFNNRGSGVQTRFYKNADGKKERVILGGLTEKMDECIMDISGAIDFLKGRGFEEIILSSHSLGCSKIAYYAMKTGYADKMIMLAPCDSCRSRGDKEKEEIRKKILPADGVFDIFRYRDGKAYPLAESLKANILVQIGTEDSYYEQGNKIECINYIKSAFKNTKVSGYIIDGADHSYRGKEEEMIKNVISFIKK